METIYYVGYRLSRESEILLSRYYNLAGIKKLHSTVIYSKRWFPYRWSPLSITVLETKHHEVFNGILVLRFNSEALEERHENLLAAGATWDYEGFKAHVSIGKIEEVSEGIGPYAGPIILQTEYYQTWQE